MADRLRARRRRYSPFQRFYGAFLLLILLFLVPLGILLTTRIGDALEAEISLRHDEELGLLTAALAARWPDTGAAAGAPAAGSPAERVAASPARVDAIVDELGGRIGGRITVVDLGGRVLGDSERSGAGLLAMENHALRPEIEAARAGRDGVSSRFSTSVGEPFVYRARLLRDPSGRPVAVVRLAFSKAGILAERERAARSLLAALAVTLLFAGGLAAVLARRLARPIQFLRRSAERMTRGELGREIQLRTGDELEDLAAALNRMSGDLAAQRAELVAEKEQLLRVLEGMVEGVLVTDRDGRIVQVNGAFQEMFGLARPPVGRTTLEALRNTALEGILARTWQDRHRVAGHVRLSHPAERDLEIEAAPLGEDGALHGLVAVFHDVTRLRKLEGVRRDFVANVSHEIRTPVTAIRGYAETLRSAGGSDEERSRFAEIIVRHADRLTALVDDLLALASLETDGYVLRLERVPVGELLESVVEAFGPRAADKAVVLVAESATPGLELRGDRDKLEQVLANLVDNAIEHTEPGGRVTLGATQERDRLLLRVTDTGCGIPASDLERIFERFFRVDRARSRKLGGTGLGLAIVKHIVLLHGGDVRVRSRLGEGSEFTVELPIDGPKGPAVRRQG